MLTILIQSYFFLSDNENYNGNNASRVSCSRHLRSGGGQLFKAHVRQEKIVMYEKDNYTRYNMIKCTCTNCKC